VAGLFTLMKGIAGILGMMLLLAAERVGLAEAKLAVSGYGLFGNRELKALVSVLKPPDQEVEAFSASFIEDAVLILFSRLERDGYLQPKFTAELTLRDGTKETHGWETPLGEPLPRALAATELRFKVEPGVRFYFEEVRFEGLTAIPLREAAHFFMEADALIKLKQNRVYSPDRLQAGTRNLRDALERAGHGAAVVTATNLVTQTNSGAVTVDIIVREGPQSRLRSIQMEIIGSDTNQAPRVQRWETNAVFSRLWLQDFEQTLKRGQYKQGYANARVEFTQVAREAHAETEWIDLRARVYPGEKIRVGEIKFEGDEKTRESVMRRRVRVHAGDLLNPMDAERGRYRLARLGIFDSVELRYDEVDEKTRDVIYTVDEGKRMDFSILAGWGSYELLRGGFEWELYNLWGSAHRSRLKAVQSIKSTSGEYTYTVPELFGEEFDGFANAAFLRRDEPAFTREEFGGGAGVSRHFPSISSDMSLRYNYQVLNATRRDVPPEDGLREANVGSFIFDFRHDRRDNPLTPRRGYKIFSNLEIASEALLGDVNYQRMETSASYHRAIGEIRWLHFGLAHGFVTTERGPARDLPVTRRFFPGGDSSIRGFQFGEAAPRDANGQLVGAETYTLANVEFEQGLTRSWSLVFFVDAVGMARRLEDYPFNEGLYSVGGGVRWKTIIGPVRLEYGHNLNPRDEDPSGTVHISIGFPF
jgi:outer membrane protein insertion porin family